MIGGPEVAVILAAGRGTRMAADASRTVELDADQRAAASRGWKALMPISNRPFLAWTLDAVAAAGFRMAVVVTGPDTAFDGVLAAAPISTRRAVQDEPRGTADAVRAAESVVTVPSFAVINGDNWYAPSALRVLRASIPPATVGFSAGGLTQAGIPPERMTAFALMTANSEGYLRQLIEKPGAETRAAVGHDALVSMTCWSFPRAIFEYCRAVTPSPRGELELPDAVLALAAAQPVRVLRHDGPVFDLSTASDVIGVAERLRQHASR